MNKTICGVLCLILLIAAVQLPAFSEDSETKLQNITYTSCSLTISGVNSTSDAALHTRTSMSISIAMELQKLKSGSYSTIKTWSASKTGTQLSMEETRLINVLASYRLKVTFTAGNETVISYAYP